RLEKPPLSQEALNALVNYSWPGNVRELEHVVQRLMIFTGGYTIQASDLPATVTTNAPRSRVSDAGCWSDDQYLAFACTYLDSYAGERAHEVLLEKMEKSLIVE